MKNINVKIDDRVSEYPAGVRISEIAADCEDTGLYVAAFANGKLRELGAKLGRDTELEFVKIDSVIGYDMYKRSLILLMLKAFKDVLRLPEDSYVIDVMYSLGRGFFCKLIYKTSESDYVNPDTDAQSRYKVGAAVTDELLADVKVRMQELVDADMRLEKKPYNTTDAVTNFSARGMDGKVKLLRYRRASKINLYDLGGYLDYFYGYMVPSTGMLTSFDLVSYEDGFVLVVPERSTMQVKVPYTAPKKLYKILRKSEDWGNALGIEGVGELNDVIVSGGIGELMLVQEALMEKQIANIADSIREEDKKIVLIAGPSSSGKTTFSNRLSIQLKAHGMKPHPIAMDNFFKERKDTPLDAEGKYDFESIGAMDLRLFNDCMTGILEGREVAMPTFNFNLGTKEYLGDTLQLGADDVLVVEGIHALNPESTESLPKESCYKVYISALTQLNLDEHNRISTTDTRLLRRIVRDARTRGNDATKTISMWQSVRRGEEKNIFPFQEEADTMFNSALIYELPAIKQFAEPLLFRVDPDSEEYYEAKRLLKFLDYFLGIDVSSVPQNSLLREFIGGGCFKV